PRSTRRGRATRGSTRARPASTSSTRTACWVGAPADQRVHHMVAMVRARGPTPGPPQFGTAAGNRPVPAGTATPGVLSHTGSVTMPVDFSVNLRGYDRGQVDSLVHRLTEALGSADPVLREQVRQEVSVATFDVAIRGYDRAQVDRYVSQARAELDR